MMPVTVGESGESSFMRRGSFVGGGPMQESRASLDAVRYETCMERRWVIGSKIQRRRLTMDSQYSSQENETRRNQTNPLLN